MSVVAVLQSLGVDATPRRISSGSMNEHWACGPYVLRRYAPNRTSESIAYEHDILRAAAAANWPVAVPVWCSGRYALFPRLAGRRPRHVDPYELGRMLARLHHDLAPCAATVRPGFSSLLGFADRCLFWNESEPRGLRELAGRAPLPLANQVRAEINRTLDDLDVDGLPMVVAHGDFHRGNLLYAGGVLTGVLDFDFARPEPRIVDVAITENFVLSRDALVAGYSSLSLLDEREIAMMGPVLRAFHLQNLGFWIAVGAMDRVQSVLGRVRYFAPGGLWERGRPPPAGVVGPRGRGNTQ